VAEVDSFSKSLRPTQQARVTQPISLGTSAAYCVRDLMHFTEAGCKCGAQIKHM